MDYKCHYPSIDQSDLNAVQAAVLAGWFTSGRLCDEFERAISQYLGVKHSLFTTSGSSASLLAFHALTSRLHKDARILPGDEVITTALCFPTTIAPIVQYGAIPVFVDVDLQTANATINHIRDAISPKTKAVVLAHTLGNPFDGPAIRALCDELGLWLIEDNCDALGSEIDDRKTGSFGDLSITSFYPAHHITTGEGGMVSTNNDQLASIVRSLRDWGRDCKCKGGEDGICGHRFNHQHGTMPSDYDHKYIFSHLGFNLKNTELAAALGLNQLKRLPEFIERRRSNWLKYQILHHKFPCQYYIDGANPSPFGYLLGCDGMRPKIIQALSSKGIQTRMLFAGNILRQPCFVNDKSIKYRISGSLENTDKLTDDYLWLGVAPTVSAEQIVETTNTLLCSWIDNKLLG